MASRRRRVRVRRRSDRLRRCPLPRRPGPARRVCPARQRRSVSGLGRGPGEPALPARACHSRPDRAGVSVVADARRADGIQRGVGGGGPDVRAVPQPDGKLVRPVRRGAGHGGSGVAYAFSRAPALGRLPAGRSVPGAAIERRAVRHRRAHLSALPGACNGSSSRPACSARPFAGCHHDRWPGQLSGRQRRAVRCLVVRSLPAPDPGLGIPQSEAARPRRRPADRLAVCRRVARNGAPRDLSRQSWRNPRLAARFLRHRESHDQARVHFHIRLLGPAAARGGKRGAACGWCGCRERAVLDLPDHSAGTSGGPHAAPSAAPGTVRVHHPGSPIGADCAVLRAGVGALPDPGLPLLHRRPFAVGAALACRRMARRRLETRWPVW